MPNALRSPSWVERNPEARADDVNKAFDDPSIKAVIASIGGEDAIRLIPYVDLSVLSRNPKVLLGYSDVTALHFGCIKAGLGSFYGPTVMSGFAENCGMHGFTEQSLRKTIFEANAIGEVSQNLEGWTVEWLDWADTSNQVRRRNLSPSHGHRVIQGKGRASGHLIGGCADTLEMLKGTQWWPPASKWERAILFYETSEEAPPPAHVRRWLRNFGVQGILSKISAFMFGRPGGQIDVGSDYTEYERVVLQVLAEFGAQEIPVMVDLDIGHTDPRLTIPYGAQAEIDCERCTLSIIENAVV
jgi:muramoyltetrapeptide carboxypeptidase LdcA involved in peptidoglycan recycling